MSLSILSRNRYLSVLIIIAVTLFFSAVVWETDAGQDKNPVDIQINWEGFKIDSDSINLSGIKIKKPIGETCLVEVNNHDLVKIGGNIDVKEGEIVTGDAVAIGGSVTIAGKVKGDAVAIGGNMILKSTAVVEGDVVSIGGQLQKEPGAQIKGDTACIGSFLGAGMIGLLTAPFRTPVSLALNRTSIIQWTLLYQLARLIVLLILTCIITAFLPKRINRITEVINAHPFKMGLIGFLGKLLILPLILLMIFTIVGIGLIPVLIIAILVAMLMGFAAASLFVGRKLRQSANWKPGSDLGAVILGIFTIASISILAGILSLFSLSPITAVILYIGATVKVIASIVGFGGVLATKFGRPERG